MTNVNVQFDVDAIIRYIKQMNQARINLVSETINWKNLYGEVSVLEWNGASRREFHAWLFGSSDNSGVIGTIGKGKTIDDKPGFCTQLNNLIYTLEQYVIEVVKRDSGGKHIINMSEFQADISAMPSVNTFVPYVYIDSNSIRFSDKVNTLFNTLQNRISKLNECVSAMISSLNGLLQNTWNDNVIREIETIVKALETRVSTMGSYMTGFVNAYSDIFEGVSTISTQSTAKIENSSASISSSIDYN